MQVSCSSARHVYMKHYYNLALLTCRNGRMPVCMHSWAAPVSRKISPCFQARFHHGWEQRFVKNCNDECIELTSNLFLKCIQYMPEARWSFQAYRKGLVCSTAKNEHEKWKWFELHNYDTCLFLMGIQVVQSFESTENMSIDQAEWCIEQAHSRHDVLSQDSWT